MQQYHVRGALGMKELGTLCVLANTDHTDHTDHTHTYTHITHIITHTHMSLVERCVRERPDKSQKS